MYLPTMALILFAASTSATASPPNTSNTDLQINNAPTLVMKSRTTVHLRRQDAQSYDAAHHALQRRARVMRDLPDETTATRNGARGVKSLMSTARATKEGMVVRDEQRTVRVRQQTRRSKMRERRQRRRTAQAQRQRMPKILPKLA